MTAAIHFETEAYQVAHGKPMGRHFAGYGFLSAFARHASGQTVTGYVKNPNWATNSVGSSRTSAPTARRLHRCGQGGSIERGRMSLHTEFHQPAQAWQRELHGSRAWSLCGVNHTLSSARAMDGLYRPADGSGSALGCHHLYLQRVHAGDRDPVLATGGIPDLAARGEPLRQASAAGDSSRRRLRLPGRSSRASGRGTQRAWRRPLATSSSSFSAGCPSMPRPIRPPMYLALERLACPPPGGPGRVRLGRQRRQIVQAFADARVKLCPSVRSIILDDAYRLARPGLGFAAGRVLLPARTIFKRPSA